ncbi:hypothetical protein [Nonomuraea phyllanthi]|nr:hypothetical protein [Nonomuraea phyllanthi]
MNAGAAQCAAVLYLTGPPADFVTGRVTAQFSFASRRACRLEG